MGKATSGHHNLDDLRRELKITENLGGDKIPLPSLTEGLAEGIAEEPGAIVGLPSGFQCRLHDFMVRLLIFNALYAFSSLFALIRGGAPERIGAIILIADFQLSAWVVAPMHSRFSGMEWPMFAVDSAASPLFTSSL